MTKFNITRLAAVLLAVWMLLALLVLPASAAEETGTVKVRVENASDGIPLYLIDIGDYKDGQITVRDDYRDFGVDPEKMKTTKGMSEAAALAYDAAMETGIDGKVARIDEDGEALFEDVPLDNLYLIIQGMGKETVNIQPVIFTLPMVSGSTVTKNPVIKAKSVDSRSKEYQGAVILNKTGYEKTRLPDAVFSFSQKVYYTNPEKVPEDADIGSDGEGDFYWKVLSEELVTDENGQITVSGLPLHNTYRFVEVEAPEHYVLDPTPHIFDITVKGGIKTQNDLYVRDYGKPEELTIKNEIDPDDPPDEVKDGDTPIEGSDSAGIEGQEGEQGQNSVADQQHQDEDKKDTRLTGDDIMKYIGIGAIVLVSLGVIIFLFVIGGKDKKKEK